MNESRGAVPLIGRNISDTLAGGGGVFNHCINHRTNHCINHCISQPLHQPAMASTNHCNGGASQHQLLGHGIIPIFSNIAWLVDLRHEKSFSFERTALRAKRTTRATTKDTLVVHYKKKNWTGATNAPVGYCTPQKKQTKKQSTKNSRTRLSITAKLLHLTN